MTQPQYDFMEGAVGVGIQQIIKDEKNEDVILDATTDTVMFRWWNQDETVANEAPAQIVNSPSNIVEYVTQAGDLKPGTMKGLFTVNAPGKPHNGPTEPQNYLVGAANP